MVKYGKDRDGLHSGKIGKHRADVFQASVYLNLNKRANYKGQIYVTLVCYVVVTLPKNIAKLTC